MSNHARLLRLKWPLLIVTVLVLFFMAAQLFRPQVNNFPLHADRSMPDSVKSILKAKCYDCHSNETRLSWFDKITPINFLVARDIQAAREAINFSGWDYLSKDRQKAILFESLNQLQFHAMPLRSYSVMHPAKAGTPGDMSSLQSYVATWKKIPMPDSVKTAAWLEQYTKWIKGTITTLDARNAPNGIAYKADTRQWGLVSISEHLDDDRTRVVLGNKIAMDAIRKNQTNPWPDGSILAKLAWFEVVDSEGLVRQGAFKQIAFMIKDKNKYRSTLGWGFAQWEEGLQLRPHGKNVFFTSECANCHRPMRKNDYVFSIPVRPLEKTCDNAQLICLYMDNEKGTMSALYGNTAAADYARTATWKGYPPGSELSLYTWKQQQDPHWFGALVPGSIKHIETVNIGKANPSDSNTQYTFYRIDTPNNVSRAKRPDERIDFILRQRAAVSP